MIECVHNYTSAYEVNRGTIGQKHWYEYVPKSVQTSQGGKVTIFWKQQEKTDRNNSNNKTGIMIRDNEKEACMLIDVAISGDRNVVKKEAEKILIHKDLTLEIQRMWNVKNKGDTSNNGGDWDYFQVIQKIHEQHNRKI